MQPLLIIFGPLIIFCLIYIGITLNRIADFTIEIRDVLRDTLDHDKVPDDCSSCSKYEE